MNAPAAPATGAPARAARAVLGALAVTTFDALLLLAALGGLHTLFVPSRAGAWLAVGAWGGVVLALLRPGRAQQPVATRREATALLIALLLVPLATPPVAALGERFGLLPWFAVGWVEWAGVGV